MGRIKSSGANREAASTEVTKANVEKRRILQVYEVGRKSELDEIQTND